MVPPVFASASTTFLMELSLARPPTRKLSDEKPAARAAAICASTLPLDVRDIDFSSPSSGTSLLLPDDGKDCRWKHSVVKQQQQSAAGKKSPKIGKPDDTQATE
mmetsp:Transcript_137945/g.358380  ORF Transcript_137945/g.358380 Transcript_137945/m.358380 type:complete len:104 (+) Transcript_137945:240-551(+)